MVKNLQKLLSTNKLAILVIILGSASWSLTMVKSGLFYNYGMGFWGPNGHDGVWHIALAESIARGSFGMPVFAGEVIKNYHIGYDLLLAFVHRITLLPIPLLYFQILPPVIALLVGVLVYRFVLAWKSSKLAALLSTFLVYFAGGFGWAITLFRSEGIGGESMFWSQQAISTLINPPFALSLVILMLGLWYILKLQDSQRQKYTVLVSALCLGVLLSIKVYAGILALCALSIVAVVSARRQKSLRYASLFSLSLAISLALFLPINTTATSMVEARPFWFLETMMLFEDRLGWPKFASAMVNYAAAGNYLYAMVAYAVSMAIFIVGNFGVRILGIFYFVNRERIRKLSDVDLFISLIIVGGVAAPMLFVQSGTPWNTIQFTYYSLFFSSIYAGIWLSEFLKNRSILTKSTTLVLITVLAVPTTAATLSAHYLPGRAPSKLSVDEHEALSFLRNMPPGVVLTIPFNRPKAIEAINDPPRPLRLYESTSYVSAFSAKPVWLEDEVNLEIMGYDWQTRREMVDSAMASSDPSELHGFINRENISYVYYPIGQLEDTSVFSDLKLLFANEEALVFGKP